MRGVIQVRCQRPARTPAQALGDVQFVEEQQRARGRRPPFQRAGMRQRIEAAPIGLEQLRQREVVHDAGEPGRCGKRALGIGQGVIGGQGLARAHAQQRRHPGDPLRGQAPGEAERPALRRLQHRLAEKRVAAVAAVRCEGEAFGVEGHGRIPNKCLTVRAICGTAAANGPLAGQDNRHERILKSRVKMPVAAAHRGRPRGLDPALFAPQIRVPPYGRFGRFHVVRDGPVGSYETAGP